jgi:hypothetical protein
MNEPENRDSFPKSDTFSKSEERALHAWEAPLPPPGFADQVLARARVAPAKRRRAIAYGLCAAAAAACVAIAFAAREEAPVRSGDLAATSRTTVGIGDRAVAVAEAGTSLSWRVAPRGAATVEQGRGNAFYRVDPGAPFVVRTQAGEVRVRGTCFRVEVEEMKAKTAGLTGVVAGAAVASAVFVTVYEGTVIAASPHGERAVSAGERAEMRPEQAPSISVAQTRSAARPAPLRREGAPAQSAATVGAAQAAPAAAASATAQSAELAKLRQEVKALRAELARSPKRPDPVKMLDFSKEELEKMAEKCELRWDTPSFDDKNPSIGSSDAQALGLNDTERSAVNDVLRQAQQKMRADLRKLYVEVTGDEAGGVLSLWAMQSEIVDKSSRQDLQLAFQRLARERAGLQTPPADLSALSAVERLFRLLVSAGDNAEKAIGAQIGPDLARRYRELHGGFGSRNRSSFGCPSQ